jgi:hypothetical protein
MKERPILFSAPMVRALLDGSKTQTRRVLKQATGPSLSVGIEDESGVAELSWLSGNGPGHDVCETIKRVPCPYGQPGDRLWVRETYFAFGRWETRFSAKKGRDEWHFVDMTMECGKTYAYAADGAPHDFKKGNQRSTITPAWWKRPAIFMPRAACRITLEITGVRVERLQDISEADAIAEGLTCKSGLYATPGEIWHIDPRKAYRDLWESINGPGSWDANPWVWVIEFKRVQS